MDKSATEAFDGPRARSAVDSLRGDFDELIGIFDRQLGRLPQTDAAARKKVREARLAAERGRKLSENLAAFLRMRA